MRGPLTVLVPPASGTLVEYPVVADVDNDGSAEPACRVWNQHAYLITNVREDGTIPQNMKKICSMRSAPLAGRSRRDCDPELHGCARGPRSVPRSGQLAVLIS